MHLAHAAHTAPTQASLARGAPHSLIIFMLSAYLALLQPLTIMRCACLALLQALTIMRGALPSDFSRDTHGW
jgi:hypothetical protein